METTTSLNCSKEFTIASEDFDFYKKIDVPAPTWCPTCRLKRRVAWCNMFTLYKRPCDLCKKDSISVYPPGAPYVIYCPKCWWSDNWDPFSYGREYDFSRSFFEQFNEQLHRVPISGLNIDAPTMQSSPYNNSAGHLKNCYLTFFADPAEDSAYGFYLANVRQVVDTSLSMICELVYDSRNTFKDNHCIGVENTIESIDCAFLRNCTNCQNCYASANLRNKKYYIFNQSYSREEYFEKIKQWNLGSYQGYQALRKAAREHWAKYPPRPSFMDLSVGCTGNYVFESKNVKEGYEIQSAQDSKYVHMMISGPVKDCYDVFGWGNNLTLSYESQAVGENASQMRFCTDSGINAYDCEYSKLSTGGGHHFGCVSVKKGEYVILNKKYSKEEYEILVFKIREHMKTTREYGEFFPFKLSTHSYNETMAQDFFPLSEAEATMQGSRWQSPDVRTYSITKKVADLPDHIRDCSDDILNDVIECEKCGKGFKMIVMELDFLRQMSVPLPRRCPFCRINEKFTAWVRQMQLTARVCDTCGKEFRTPDTREEFPNILCKDCWTETYN